MTTMIMTELSRFVAPRAGSRAPLASTRRRAIFDTLEERRMLDGDTLSDSSLLVALAPAAQFSGAIYTSTADGSVVNQNLYDAKIDVYLNGGPQNQNAAGLPDGEYYFQVTNPSGSLLLSSDNAVERQLVVVGGVIAGNGGIGTHANGAFNPNNGSTPVQLAPFDDTDNAGGEYKVWLIKKDAATIDPNDPRVLLFSNSDSKTDNFKIKTDEASGSISGSKFCDAVPDGVWDKATEPGLSGWQIYLDDNHNAALDWVDGGLLNGVWDPGEGEQWTTTALDGSYSFTNLPAGAYDVKEVLQPGWISTLGSLGEYAAVQVGVGQQVTDIDFGNVKLGAGGGHTLGFWSNRNGQALIDSADLLALRCMNLRNANGTNFDPTTAAQVKSWLLSANATNMSYMLSAQLAAMKLNVLNGFVSASSYVYVGPSSLIQGKNAFGFIQVGALINEANAELGLHGTALAGAAWRPYQEALKNALDNANNNLNFAVC